MGGAFQTKDLKLAGTRKNKRGRYSPQDIEHGARIWSCRHVEGTMSACMLSPIRFTCTRTLHGPSCVPPLLSHCARSSKASPNDKHCSNTRLMTELFGTRNRGMMLSRRSRAGSFAAVWTARRTLSGGFRKEKLSCAVSSDFFIASRASIQTQGVGQSFDRFKTAE